MAVNLAVNLFVNTMVCQKSAPIFFQLSGEGYIETEKSSGYVRPRGRTHNELEGDCK